ncbi:unnamed protein product [Linum trigynum]|uniref:Uncharacterized protein n=1 Tax=Linum trigynum TaxID=586398 RepID=A0AAV2GWZ9_9ROSI
MWYFVHESIEITHCELFEIPTHPLVISNTSSPNLFFHFIHSLSGEIPQYLNVLSKQDNYTNYHISK